MVSLSFRRLGDEMRNMSLEKTRQREQELVQEVDRLQNEIKSLQKSSEDSANISQQLSKDVRRCQTDVFRAKFNNSFSLFIRLKRSRVKFVRESQK